MIYSISVKEFKMTEKMLQSIEKNVKKVLKFSPNYDSDLPLLEFIIRKHKKRSSNRVIGNYSIDDNEIITKNKKGKNSNSTYYDGTIFLRLPFKPLAIRILGNSFDEAINSGFEKIYKDLNKYKGKHIRSDSEYPDHSTIRKLENRANAL